MSYVIGAGFLVLIGFAFFNYWHQAKMYNDMIIADDVAQLASILNTIDKECGIVNFEHQKNNIDFLNVIAFEGSEVGPMNLKYPKKWKGAYLKDNPTIQEKYYQVVHTKKGYFVVPGDGVELSSGKVIGKDIIFDESADIPAMISQGLSFKSHPLAVQIMNQEAQKKTKTDNMFKEAIARERMRQVEG